MSTCEGGCGVTVSDAGREAVDGYTTTVEHSVGRCRIIRTVREAGQRAVGPEGTCDVLTAGHGGFRVRVQVALTPEPVSSPILALLLGATYTVVLVVELSETHVWAHYPDHLGDLGRLVEDMIRRGLANPQMVAPGDAAGHVLAVNPYRGRS